MRPRCAKNHAEWVCIRQFEVINTLGMRDTLSKTINTAHSVLMFFSTFLGLSRLPASWQTDQNGQAYGSPKPSWCFVFAMFCRCRLGGLLVRAAIKTESAKS